MTTVNNPTDTELAELLGAAKNLLEFHDRWGMEYPYNDDLKFFLDRSVQASPQESSSSGRIDPDKEEPLDKSGDRIANQDELTALIAECCSCPLGENAAGTGRITPESSKDRPASLFIVCDPPWSGTTSSAPIEGEARNLLGRMLAAIDLSLEEVYLTSVLKCLPADKNLPVDRETGICLSWLKKEVELLNPGIIFTLGPLSARLLLETDKQLFTLRGRLRKWGNTPLVASYHPEMLLRHRELKKASWEDLKLIKGMI